MTSAANVLLIELPVFSAAILTTIASLFRSSRERDKKINDRLDILGAHMIESKVTDLQMVTDVAELKRSLPQVREAGAITTALLDDHLRWHDRNRNTNERGT